MGRTLLQDAQADDVRAEGRGLDGRRSTRPPTTSTACGSPTSSAARSARSSRSTLDLGLDAPLIPWHTLRGRIGELAGALGVAVRRDRQGRARRHAARAEVRERVGGGSTSMPHKHNPVAAISALGCARQAPGARRHAARRDGAGARARRRRLALRVGAAQPAPDHDRLGRELAAHVPRDARGRHRRRATRRRRHRRRRDASSTAHWRTDDPPPPHLRPRGRAARSSSPTRSARRSRCGTRSTTRWPSSFRLIRYDTRGHGGSEIPPGPYSIDDVGSDVVDLLDHLGIEQRALRRPLARRHDRHVARRQRAGARRPARPALHLREARPARDVGRPRRTRSASRAPERSSTRRSSAGSPRATATASTCRPCARCSRASTTRATRTAAR